MKKFFFVLCIALFVTGCTSNLARRVESNLDARPDIRVRNIEIESRGGRIVLRGSVPTREDRMLVQEVAAQTSGVSSVENRLEVVGSTAVNINTAALAERVRQSFAADPHLGSYQIAVEADGDAVTLTGVVKNERDRRAIESIASKTSGVRAVRNDIAVLPPPDDATLRTRVLQSLAQEPDISLKGLDLRVANGIVTVAGRVANHREIDRVLSHILMVEGVQDARSNVVIGAQE